MTFFEKLIKPVYSGEFYAKVAKEPPKKALGFFTLFTVVLGILGAVLVDAVLAFGITQLPRALDDIDNFPEIRIENGQLYYSGDMPLEISQQGQYIGIDTTGEITSIPDGYYQGLLLTKSTAIFRSEEYPQDMEITYNEILKQIEISSFKLNREIAQQYITTYGTTVLAVLMIITPFVLIIAKLISGFIALLVMSLIGALIISAMGVKEESFKKSLITAAYVTVPYTYIKIIEFLFSKALSKLGINIRIGNICCLLPMIWAFSKWAFFFILGANAVKESESNQVLKK